MNATLERAEGEIKARFATGAVADIDKTMGPLDDVLANWSVARARDNAWITARTIHVLRDMPMLYKPYMASLARNVGFAGRSLLVSARRCSWRGIADGRPLPPSIARPCEKTL